VDLTSFAEAVHSTSIAEWMRTSLKAMPVVESIHVLSAAVVFGTVLIVDLRLLGFPSTSRRFTRVSGELMRATWVAFVISAMTGALMFAPNSITYVGNTAFQLKMIAILAAGVNMGVFELVTARSVVGWDKDTLPPTAARIAGVLSIVIWTAVIFIARWIGFTKGYDFAIPEDVDLQFNFPG
jgi:Family of unknown function (DUF6644)